MKSFGDRKFKLWYYTISHGQLLLRSIKDDNNTTNIDVMFLDVDYIELPRYLSDVKLEKAQEKDINYIQQKLGEHILPESIRIIISKNGRYIVVASIMKVVENELEMFDLPFDTFF
ncbi:hypothetical protein [Paenibacillus sp. WLX2291]|uniref:hypothetical protein n=1 Tax=Paenibacillus sp. WLX2291 TaxID=3296934 RepID=UPI0039845643